MENKEVQALDSEYLLSLMKQANQGSSNNKEDIQDADFEEVK